MRFKAGVQYGDWKGTAAADNADFSAMSKYLQQAGLLGTSEFLVGFEVYVGETRGTEPPFFSSRAFIIQSGDFETAKEAVDSQNPLPVEAKDLDLKLADFFKLFKRFNLVLTHRGLDLENREYREA